MVSSTATCSERGGKKSHFLAFSEARPDGSLRPRHHQCHEFYWDIIILCTISSLVLLIEKSCELCSNSDPEFCCSFLTRADNHSSGMLCSSQRVVFRGCSFNAVSFPLDIIADFFFAFTFNTFLRYQSAPNLFLPTYLL